MAGRLNRVSPGQPIRPAAADWNLMLEAAAAHAAAKFDTALPSSDADPTRTRIRVRNTTAAALDRCDVVALAEPTVPPSANLAEFLTNPTIDAAAPTADDRGRWAVLAEPIPPDRFGLAWVAGVVAVPIFVSDESAGYVDIGPGSESVPLETRCHGSARIIWRESGTGPKWALVRLGVRDDEGRGYVFTLLDSLAGGSALAELTLYDGTEHIVTTIVDPIGAFARLDEGDTGLVRYECGAYYVWQANCPRGD